MTDTDSNGLPQKTVEALRSVFKRYPGVKKVILYGSRAKGTYKPGSDIDLAIVAPNLTTTDRLKIENEIDDLLLPYKVDLCLFHQLENDELIAHIQRVGMEF
jgi:uncharacterized protein